MSQNLIFLLAERVALGKSGGSKRQRDAIYPNMRAIRKALKDPKDPLKIQRAHSSKTILAALKGRGWQHRTSGSLSLCKQGGQDVGQTYDLVRYGGLKFDAQGKKSFKVTDRRLKAIWDAIPRFIKSFGGQGKLALKGDLLVQQASVLALLSRRHQQVVAVKQADALATTQEAKEAAAQVRKETARKERVARVNKAVRVIQKWRRDLVTARIQDHLNQLDLSEFGEWDDDEEEREAINEHAVAQAAEEEKVAAEKKQADEKKAAEEAEWLASSTTAAAGTSKPEKQTGKKKKKKKKSHQVRKWEAAKARKKAAKKG